MKVYLELSDDIIFIVAMMFAVRERKRAAEVREIVKLFHLLQRSRKYLHAKKVKVNICYSAPSRLSHRRGAQVHGAHQAASHMNLP